MLQMKQPNETNEEKKIFKDLLENKTLTFCRDHFPAEAYYPRTYNARLQKVDTHCDPGELTPEKKEELSDLRKCMLMYRAKIQVKPIKAVITGKRKHPHDRAVETSVNRIQGMVNPSQGTEKKKKNAGYL